MKYAAYILPSMMVLLLAAACSGGTTSSSARALDATTVATSITVTSPDFTNNSTLPRAHTCDGPGTAPTISWSAVPTDTKSVAVVVDDPDAPKGPFVHWVVIGLPPRAGTISATTPGLHALDNTGGTRGWTPPCPPAGSMHHYRFTVYALRDYVCATNGDDVGEPGCAEPSAQEALGQIRGTAIAKGALVGTYRR